MFNWLYIKNKWLKENIAEKRIGLLKIDGTTEITSSSFRNVIDRILIKGRKNEKKSWEHVKSL